MGVAARCETALCVAALCVASLGVAGPAAAGPAAAPVYDLVIAGGRVMDPQTHTDRIANVGVSHGTIAAISARPLQGARTIDAHGLVVAPGFIDLHSHAQYPFGYDQQARDGVTTSLELEAGVFPVAPFYAERAGKTRINYGASVSQQGIRIRLMTDIPSGTMTSEDPAAAATVLALKSVWAEQPMTDAQIAKGQALFEQEFKAGGLGLGLLYEYEPGAGRDEIFRFFQTAAKLHAPIFVHARASAQATPSAISDVFQELIADSAATGAPVHICHIGSKAMGSVGLMLEMIDGAHARGVDVTTEVYPYTAGSTLIGSALFDEGWRDHLGIDYGALEWPLTGERLTQASFTRYRHDDPAGWVIIHSIPEASVDSAIEDPAVMIASDAVPYVDGHGHPRGSGTFSRVLGVYVRERRDIPLMLALAKMTLLPAQRLEAISPAMRRKGRVQVGADADLTLFDPALVKDRATYAQPTLNPVGIPYVIVAGVPVVDHGQIVEAAHPGRPIRSGA